MQFDPLNDALAKLFNAEQAGKFNVDLAPASKLLGSRSTHNANLRLCWRDREERRRSRRHIVQLRGAINECGVVKPRHSVRRQEFDKWKEDIFQHKISDF